ncbi:PerC family transcriptional regulator [Cronobacter dublinensis subsp. dublinensis]|nr:PerC family transcriptional regulator [Cronobacter dublinensis subsp. dublinensis]EGT5729927.1 PerC family transcriptional regulator [Cronobacter dublinensis subsp. dublinensis]
MLMASYGIRGKSRLKMLASATDSLAETLESQGLWLRAAKRWGDVFFSCNDDDLRELYVQRREDCIRRANESYRSRNQGCATNDLLLVKKGIDDFYRTTNLGPVSNWYIDWN